MKFVFHPEAEAEFFEAIEYYEASVPGLGQDFSVEVLKAIQNIIVFPLAWPVLTDDIRRCMTNRFPFGVIYGVEAGQVYVYAVMHLKREPNYWKNRH